MLINRPVICLAVASSLVASTAFAQDYLETAKQWATVQGQIEACVGGVDETIFQAVAQRGAKVLVTGLLSPIDRAAAEIFLELEQAVAFHDASEKPCPVEDVSTLRAEASALAGTLDQLAQ